MQNKICKEGRTWWFILLTCQVWWSHSHRLEWSALSSSSSRYAGHSTCSVAIAIIIRANAQINGPILVSRCSNFLQVGLVWNQEFGVYQNQEYSIQLHITLKLST
jgi:hypothetical protein